MWGIEQVKEVHSQVQHLSDRVSKGEAELKKSTAH